MTLPEKTRKQIGFQLKERRATYRVEKNGVRDNNVIALVRRNLIKSCNNDLCFCGITLIFDWSYRSIVWYNHSIMTQLAEILSSKVRAEIFRLLFGIQKRELHVREIERQTGFSIATVRQELQKLVRMQLLITRRDGNRLYYRANVDHPIYPDIRNLILKTVGLVEILKRVLDKDSIKVAFVFGSIAQNQEGARSDVDLMVIGKIGLRTLTGWLSGITEEIGRDINPHILSTKEFKKRKHSGDHFLNTVLNSPRLFIVGNEDELTAVGS